MSKFSKTLIKTISISIAGVVMASGLALAQEMEYETLGRKGKSSKHIDAFSSDYQASDWMHQDVQEAWTEGFLGQRTNITFVDDFRSGRTFAGDLGLGEQELTHGEWTRMQGKMLAPEARVRGMDFSRNRAVKTHRRKLDTINLSYGMIAADGYEAVRWSRRESSIINAAEKGKAVVVKAAGNDYGTAVGEANKNDKKDYLNSSLIGTETGIFVGALSSHGSVENQAVMANYSNIAGDNLSVQEQFLVVGVESEKTGLYGTSFAAPIVSGYSAIIGSKFRGASAKDVTNRLLNKARTDTVKDYEARVHGQGEASLSRALAPDSIR